MTTLGSRSVERTRGVGTCSECRRQREGVTRVERRPWEGEKTFHLCDDCAAAVVERPLEVVLAEFEGDRG